MWPCRSGGLRLLQVCVTVLVVWLFTHRPCDTQRPRRDPVPRKTTLTRLLHGACDCHTTPCDGYRRSPSAVPVSCMKSVAHLVFNSQDVGPHSVMSCNQGHPEPIKCWNVCADAATCQDTKVCADGASARSCAAMQVRLDMHFAPPVGGQKVTVSPEQ